jgi:hypothetical protein
MTALALLYESGANPFLIPRTFNSPDIEVMQRSTPQNFSSRYQLRTFPFIASSALSAPLTI